MDPSILVAHLTSTAKSDDQRAWALFVWICHNVNYDVEAHYAFRREVEKDATQMLATKILMCGGFANLYTALAKEAGLSVQTMMGYCRAPKDSDEGVGKNVQKDGATTHAWSLVLLQGEWVAVDCTWGAGGFTADEKFERKFRPVYFGMPADQLAFTHHSLTKGKQYMPYSRFIMQPVVFADFFENGLRFSPEANPEGLITLEDSNTTSMRLVVPPNMELLVDLGGRKDLCLQEVMADGTTQLRLSVPRGATQHAMRISVGGGSYEEGQYALACIFAIKCSRSPTTFVEPFPLVYYSVFRRHGLKFSEPLPTGTFELTKQNTVQIKLCAPSNVQAVAAVGDGEVFTQRRGGEIIVLAQCPQGDHELDIFVQRRAGDGWTDLEHALTYYVNVKPNCPINSAGFPEMSDSFRDLGMFLEAPLTGVLKSGKTRFRVRVDQKRVAKVVAISGGCQKALTLIDGALQCDLDVVAPNVQLGCSTPADPSDFDVALEWTVK
jgi:hypothetical protein